jgi:hypothetical protein
MIGDGFLTMPSHGFILMWIRAGEDITQNTDGMDTTGTMSGYPIKDFDIIGKTGATIDIGKGIKHGMSVIINPEHNSRDMK